MRHWLWKSSSDFIEHHSHLETCYIDHQTSFLDVLSRSEEGPRNMHVMLLAQGFHSGPVMWKLPSNNGYFSPNLAYFTGYQEPSPEKGSSNPEDVAELCTTEIRWAVVDFFVSWSSHFTLYWLTLKLILSQRCYKEFFWGLLSLLWVLFLFCLLWYHMAAYLPQSFLKEAIPPLPCFVSDLIPIILTLPHPRLEQCYFILFILLTYLFIY